MNSAPRLIEPGVRDYIHRSLSEYRKFKDQHMNLFFNIGLFIFFVVVVGIFFWIKYKGKPTPYEIEMKHRREREYIMSKLQLLGSMQSEEERRIHLEELHKHGDLITDLPLTWHGQPEIDILHNNI